MANSTSGIFSTIVEAANIASSAPRYTNALLDNVYTDKRPAVGTVGQTITILLPVVDTTKVHDIGSGAIVIEDTAQNTVSLSVTHKQSSARRIQSFDQARSERDLAEFYLQPMIEEVLRKTNSDLVTNCVTTTAFNVNSVIAGSGAKHTRTDLESANAELFGQGAPMEDYNNLFFITSGTPYSNMVADQTMSYQYIVGNEASDDAQRRGLLMPQAGARLFRDQQFPVATGPVYTGLFAHKYAIACRFMVEPKAEDSYIREAIIMPKEGVPLKLQFFHSPVDQGYVLHVSAIYGYVVARPEYGVICHC